MSTSPAEKAEIRKNRLLAIPLLAAFALLLIWGRSQNQPGPTAYEPVTDDLNRIAGQKMTEYRRVTGSQNDLACIFSVTDLGGEIDAGFDFRVMQSRKGKNFIVYACGKGSPDNTIALVDKILHGGGGPPDFPESNLDASAFYLASPDGSFTLLSKQLAGQARMKEVMHHVATNSDFTQRLEPKLNQIIENEKRALNSKRKNSPQPKPGL